MGEYPERYISAFLTGTKVTEICEAAGFSRSKYYKLKADPDFQEVLRERRDLAVKGALEALREHFVKDVRILQEIAENPEISPQVRINAISISLQQLREWVPVVDLLQRIEALEQAENDDFSTFSGVV